MTRGASTAFLAAILFAALGAFPAGGIAAQKPVILELAAGARVGVMSLLDPEVTHFHASRQIENSFLKTYPLGWQVNAMLLTAVRERLAQLSLVAVALPPGDELTRAREQCFLDAALAKGLPKPCERSFAQFAASQHLAALIVLGPGHNDATHAGSARHRELPEYLRGWCFVTGEGKPDDPPPLLNFTELLLLDASSGGARLADREWGGDAGSWSGYRNPPDLKAFPNALLDELQPQYLAILQHQADGLFAHLQVTR
jgi:hypothetical protein